MRMLEDMVRIAHTIQNPTYRLKFPDKVDAFHVYDTH
ncbi:hypothetical protein FBZ90_102136 [Nitrospirillum pindoramense]|uniref:Uncharacterized protein n=1 Tax=Nitrospirillum amazonense TaxID=28077 RepID=A0A560HFI6_9PROT|nr:hypothetical protein FBZ90_102136 [Nitrospirillum amazonense]